MAGPGEAAGEGSTGQDASTANAIASLWSTAMEGAANRGEGSGSPSLLTGPERATGSGDGVPRQEQFHQSPSQSPQQQQPQHQPEGLLGRMKRIQDRAGQTQVGIDG